MISISCLLFFYEAKVVEYSRWSHAEIGIKFVDLFDYWTRGNGCVYSCFDEYER